MNDVIFEQWEDLEKDFQDLENTNAVYVKKLAEIVEYQNKVSKQLMQERQRIGKINNAMKIYGVTEETKEILDKTNKIDNALNEIAERLPKKSSKYLRLILGNIDVSFMNPEAKFKYKDEYEKFKLVCIIVALVLATINLLVYSRSLQALNVFFLAWYYTTISIRESILKTNGSRIKGWWRFHHILSIFASAMILVWPEGQTWRLFRRQFFIYNIYNSIIQYMQFRYQQGVLYRLKALGVRDRMDITIEGFHSWMWRGLAFLVPLLFIAYLFQLANSIVLYNLSFHEDASWHVLVLSVSFLTFFIGNTTTTYIVVREKMRNGFMNHYKVLMQRLY